MKVFRPLRINDIIEKQILFRENWFESSFMYRQTFRKPDKKYQLKKKLRAPYNDEITVN